MNTKLKKFLIYSSAIIIWVLLGIFQSEIKNVAVAQYRNYYSIWKVDTLATSELQADTVSSLNRTLKRVFVVDTLKVKAILFTDIDTAGLGAGRTYKSGCYLVNFSGDTLMQINSGTVKYFRTF